MTTVVDTSDVPTVTVRELALALNLYVADGATLAAPAESAESALRRVEQTFWQFCPRDRTRKVAVLLRFRSLIGACEARRLKALLDSYGQDAVLHVLAAAAKLRLNTKWGFNPQKLARIVESALLGSETAEPLAQAA